MYPPSYPWSQKGSRQTLSNVGCVMFGVHIIGSVHHNRIYTLPTPGPKGPTDKASYILGVVSFGVQTIGSEDHNGKYNLHTPGSKGPTEKISYDLGAVRFGIQM